MDPAAKFYEAGEPNALLHDIIRRNVRTPDHVFGDLAAQVSSGRAGGERLIALCARQGLADIEAVSDEIIARSEAATRAAIRALPAGTWHGESAVRRARRRHHHIEGGGHHRQSGRRCHHRFRAAAPAPARWASMW